MLPHRLGATAVFPLLTLLLLTQPAGCESRAVGVEDCRDIETARCESAAHCGGQIPVEDVEACKRFYRDQCLHGLAVKKDPSSRLVKDCVAAIVSAGNCARDSGPGTLIRDCSDGPELARGHEDGIQTVCDAIESPQHTNACFFLNDTGDEPPVGEGGGAGGEGGVPSPHGGASGNGALSGSSTVGGAGGG